MENKILKTKMIELTQQEINNIPMILQCHWYKEWVEEQKKPAEYIGKLAILIDGKKVSDCHWITEGIDFKII